MQVLAHLIKYTDLDHEKPRSNSSQWLKRASEEAMDAIGHPEVWEFGPSMDPGLVYRILKSLERMAAFIKTIK